MTKSNQRKREAPLKAERGEKVRQEEGKERREEGLKRSENNTKQEQRKRRMRGGVPV